MKHILKKLRRPLSLLIVMMLLFQCMGAMLPSVARAADEIYSDTQDKASTNALVKNYTDHPSATIGGYQFSVKATVSNFNVTLKITGNQPLNNTDILAAVMDYPAFMSGTLQGNAGSFTDKTRFETPTNAGMASGNVTDYRYNTSSKFVDGEMTINTWTAPKGSQVKLRPITVNANNGGATNGDNSKEYYRSYVFVVASATAGVNGSQTLAYGTFIMDAEGNMLQDSYMVRYRQNETANGKVQAVVGTMTNHIVPWGQTVQLRSNAYTRSGYEFKGWDTDKDLYKQWQVNSTATGDAQYVYQPWNAALPQPDYQKSDTLDPASVPAPGKVEHYQSTDLYAAWYPKQVQFHPMDTNLSPSQQQVDRDVQITDKSGAKDKDNRTIDVTTLSTTLRMVTLPTPQVGVPYKNGNSSHSIQLGGTTDTGTGKSFAFVVGVKVKWTDSNGEEHTATTANTHVSYGIGWSSRSDHCELSGTPSNYSNNEVITLVKVTDNVNGTTDYLLLRFEKILPGRQPVPSRDENTGLQSTVGENDDGQLFGFYSAGPVVGSFDNATDSASNGYFGKDENNQAGVADTGTMTNYYLTNGMVYEYRPAVLPDNLSYADLPNDGWREIPLPEGGYKNAAQKTAMEATLAVGAKQTLYSNITVNGNSTTAGTATVTSASFAGWPAEYGWIKFNGGLPELHGLQEGSQYAVRFREKSNRAASEAVVITISKGGGGSSTAGGLAVNLAGGNYSQEPTGIHSQSEYDRLKAAAKTMTTGSTLPLKEYPFEPVRDDSAFLGWTLGERDEEDRLILYRYQAPPVETVAVKWLDGETGDEIPGATLTSKIKGESITDEEIAQHAPEPPTHPDKIFERWEPATAEDGTITVTAKYKDAVSLPENQADEGEGGDTPVRKITVTWLDPLADPQMVGTQEIEAATNPDTLTPPETPTHEGQTFLHWEKTVDAETGNVTYTAVYEEKQNTTTYIWLDPKAPADSQQVKVLPNAEVEPKPEDFPADPAHEGWTFTEWKAGDPQTVDGVTTVTYTAQYTLVPYLIRDTVTMYADLDLPASLAAVWEGGSGNTDPDMSLVRTISFLDWDGSTKLGVVAVQKGYGMAASDYATMLEGRYDKSVMALSGFTMTPTANEGYIYNPGRAKAETAMLTDKGGYTFVGWVPGDAEFTHYPMGTDLSTIGLIDWSTYKVEDHMDVKACYVGNSKCGTANNVRYTLEYTDIERSGANYTVRVNVSRYYDASSDRFPMRMQDPILRVQINMSGNSTVISLSVPLDNKDYTSASFTFPAVMDRVQLATADIYDKNDIAANAVAYSRAIDLSNTDNTSRQNYLKYGSAYLVNDNARTATGTTASTRLSNFANAAAFTPLGITISGNSAAQTFSTKLLSTWRYLNGWTKPGSAWVKPAETVKPEDEVTLTQPQIVAIHEDTANVYLRKVSFVDTDSRAEYIAGKFTWEVAQPADPSVKTAAPAGFKIYWSRDGMTKSSKDPIAVTVTDGVYSISESVRRQYYNRYLLVCAVDGSGAELPVSAAIPIIDLACD